MSEAQDMAKANQVLRKKGMYSIYDTKSKTYTAPVTYYNDGEAIRSVTQYIQQQGGDTTLHKFPNDFILVKIGEWEEVEGKLSGHELKIITNCGELVTRGKE